MDVGPARHGWQALKAAAVGKINVKSWLGSCAGTESWSAPLECSPFKGEEGSQQQHMK